MGLGLLRHICSGWFAGDGLSDGSGWRFTVPEGGAEAVITRLIASGHGIAGLAIAGEREGKDGQNEN